MSDKFKFYEYVRVIAVVPRIRKDLLSKEGIVVGMSDPDETDKRMYGVHINEFMETFAIHEDMLESCGRIGKPEDAIARPLCRRRDS